ncbi:MAG: alpha-mannosidase, partial [Caldivirga sp.]
MLPKRSISELELRLAYLAARSFRSIKPLRWDSLGGNRFRLSVDARTDLDQVVVVDYRGSALVKVDGKPSYALDSYHRFIPLTKGSHVIEAEFTQYAAFGEIVDINPGEPYLVTRSYPAWRLWAYGRVILDLAKATNDEALKNSLLDALTEAFKKVPFTTVSRLQLLLAAKLYGLPWGVRIGQIVTDDLSNVYSEDSVSDSTFDEALGVLRGLLNALLPRFGKGGLL